MCRKRSFFGTFSCLSLLWHCLEALTASFFGTSYISLPLQEARSSGHISFRLKTYRSDALLLLAAGNPDHCLVVLENAALKVRMNLGGGDSEILSPPRLRLDDLAWHSVVISREAAQVTLSIDSIHNTSLSLPSRFHELNINHGLFVGGLGDFNEVFFGLLDNFRGCLSQIVYNGIDVFKDVKANPKTSDVYAVTWECASEFDAHNDAPISFVDIGAHITFDNLYSRTGGSIGMQIKTQAEDAVLMYNTGPASRSDFVSLELVEGKTRLVLDKGSGMIQLNSSYFVSDGTWHVIEARFNPTYMEVMVDDHMESLPTPLADNRFFDLSGPLFIGGIEVNKRARAVKQGVLRGDKSFAGCIQSLKIDSHSLGIRDTRMTLGIKAECVWAYPCLKQPCIDSAKCIQEGTDGFKCLCDEPLCVKQNFTTGYTVFTKTTHPMDLEILSLSPVDVEEGGSAELTSQHLHFVLDYEKYGIRESGVLFHIVTPPAKGKLEVDVWHKPGNPVFTLLDVNNNKVTYIHGGSETTEDSSVLELELVTGQGYILPSYLQVRHRFVLPVSVIPVNDPPVIDLPSGTVFKMAKNTKKILSKKVLAAVDPDTPPSKLRYSVISCKEGHIENFQISESPVHFFTQADVNSGLISYVHTGSKEGKITLKVSDGIEISSSVSLKVHTFDLQIFLVNNTGLKVSYNSWEYILPSNLSFVTNAPNQDIEVKYEVTGLPRFGAIQRSRGDKWQAVNQFTNKHLEKRKIRYAHTLGEPDFDEFKFKILVGRHQFPSEYAFQISFIAVSLQVFKNEILIMDQIQESFISEGFLQSITNPAVTPLNEIVYKMLGAPKYGSLYLSSAYLSNSELLTEGSTFSQEDISKGRLKYKLLHRSFSTLEDSFKFTVTSHKKTTNVQIFYIKHVPSAADADIVIERLDVHEGKKEKITKNNLHIKAPNVTSVIYNITIPPKHGSLMVLDPALVTTTRENATYFTSDEINSGLVFYIHDDSESVRDELQFVAIATDNLADFQYVGTLPFRIIMENDNQPMRALEKVLNVVSNSERVITSNDLLYFDPDVDTTPSQIQYTRRKIPNGEFFHIGEKTKPVFVFTQDDINKRKIIFRHEGSSYGKTVISVTDGQLSSTGVLEIVASEPFIEIVNNSGVIVARDGQVKITNYNFSVETNMNAWGSAIIYYVTHRPKHGHIRVKGRADADQFSQADLQAGSLRYENNGDISPKDEFRVSVRIGNISTDGVFEIRVYPEVYWELLVVLNNSTVQVDEGSKVVLDQAAIQIMHPNIAPSEIAYYIVRRPMAGYLEVDLGRTPLDNYEEHKPFGGEVSLFDQALINEGRVQYVQTQPNATEDFFVFDVSNGISGHQNLVYKILVIPKTIHLITSPVAVREGSKVQLSASNIQVQTEFYKTKIDQYLVADQPKSGNLELRSNPGKRLETFLQEQLNQGLVYYAHDDSEGPWDEFSVVAVSGAHQSPPTFINVSVIRVNDEAPRVVINEGLVIWEGSTSAILSSHLTAVDLDTEDKDLKFKIIKVPESGFLSLLPNSTTSVLAFTQRDIVEGKLRFTHTEAASGSFEFEVFDGIHRTQRQNFRISTKPLRLRIAKNKRLKVFPMMQQLISSSHLLTTTNDWNEKRVITYVVKRQPSFGRLLLKTDVDETTVATKFTQKHINMSLLIYEHTQQLRDLTTHDSFIFDVETPFADNLIEQKFSLEITVSTLDEDLSKYIGLKPLVVTEGKEAILSSKNINIGALQEFISKYPSSKNKLKLITQISGLPEHGRITIKGKQANVGDTLLSSDVEENRIRYIHDHSEMKEDRIVLTVYLSSREGDSDLLLFNDSLYIQVLPVNDQPFKLHNVFPEIKVVRFQSVLITRKDLLTTDLDNSPSEIVYEVMSGPSLGRLVLSHNFSAHIHRFTQKDVDDEKLYFIHDGSNSSGKFHFQVSDGFHKPNYSIFSIKVEDVTLVLTNHSVVLLQQASTVGYIHSKHLAVSTNGNIAHVFYNVTHLPKYGSLYVDDRPTSTFGQVNIDKGQVIYLQKDMSVMTDHFIVSVWTYDKLIEGIEIRIKVEPLVESRPLRALVGVKTLLTIYCLNATKLAALTGSNPLFQLQRLPRLGKIKKIVKRSKRSGHSYEVSEFTHEDILAGMIYYVARKLRLHHEEALQDNFYFILTVPSPGIQPAEGMLSIAVSERHRPHNDGESGPPRELKPEIHPGLTAPSRPLDSSKTSLITNEYLLVVFSGVSLVIISLLVVVVSRCTLKRRKNGVPAEVQKTLEIDIASLPPPDSRPESFLTDEFSDTVTLSHRPPSPSSSPHIIASQVSSAASGFTPVSQISDSDGSWSREISRDISPSLPQCKVTPLCPSSRQSPCQSPLSGYPYGADQEQIEEWSLYDSQPQKAVNPLLRKNQYWV